MAKFYIESHRRGVTVLELLVSLAVISLLMGLITPAIQSSREASRRLECMNHLKQFGVALSSFEATHRRFPGISSEAPVQPIPLGLGPLQYSHKASWLSVHAQLLEHMDQVSAAKQIDRTEFAPIGYCPPASNSNEVLLQHRVPVFQCPTDSVPSYGNTYRVSVANFTYPRVILGSADAAFAWCLGYVGDPQFEFQGWPASHFLDGLSHTAFACERIVGDGDSSVYLPTRDIAIRIESDVPMEPPNAVAAACDFGPTAMVGHISHSGWTWLYAGYGHTQYNHILTPNSRRPDVGVSSGVLSVQYGAITARSMHKGGVNLLLGDGAVKFVANSIDQSVWRALATIAGNEVVGDL